MAVRNLAFLLFAAGANGYVKDSSKAGKQAREQVHEAIGAVVTNARLQRLHAQLLEGWPLRLAALGGSSTAGHSLSRESPLLYFNRLAGWVNESHPHVDSLTVNSGTPASGPTYMEKCLTSQLPPEPNLVLVEYSQNCNSLEDGLALERLLRRRVLLTRTRTRTLTL